MNKNSSVLQISILVFLLFFQTSSNTITPDHSDTHIRSALTHFHLFIESTLDMWDVPGAAVTIVRNDTVVFLRGYGVCRLGHSEPVDEHTVFRTASVSKGFASALTGLIVEEGMLAWEDPVIDYLPDFRLEDSLHARSLTIEHLLSHSSGLMPHAYDDLLEANVPYKKILDDLHKVPILCVPGQCYGYQNILYSLIGDVLETVTGESYESLLHQRVFEPLDMDDASVGWVAYTTTENRVIPHKRRNYRYTPTQDKKAYYSVAPAAGVNASISDMAQWLRAMMGGCKSTLSRELIIQLTAPQIRTRQELRRFHWNGKLTDAYYGLGWRIFHYDGHTVIHHSGGIEGYMAEVSFIPEENIGIAVLFNAMPYDFFSPTFFDIYFAGEHP